MYDSKKHDKNGLFGIILFFSFLSQDFDKNTIKNLQNT